MTSTDQFFRNRRWLSSKVDQWERLRNTPAWYRDRFIKVEHFKDPETSWEINEYLISEAVRLGEPSEYYFLSLLVNGEGCHQLEADFGAGQYRRPNTPGNIVFGDEETVRQLQGSGPYHSIALYFRKDEFRARAEELLAGEMPSLEPLLARCLSDPSLAVLTRRLMNAYRFPEDIRFETKDIQDDIVLRLLTLAHFEVPSVGEGDALRPDSIQRVIDFMQANPHRDLRRDELAKVAGVVPGHFTRLFRQTVGETPKRYHLRIRIEYISQLLRSSPREIPVSSLARQCGFGSPSHFGSEFKRQVGISPEAYRAHFMQSHHHGA